VNGGSSQVELTDLIYEKEKDGQIAKITINRPERYNSLGGMVIEDLHTVLDDIERDEKIRVVIITGAGDKAFSSGGDLKQVDADREKTSIYDAYVILRRTARAFQRMRDLPKPIIAAVNGYSIGGGQELHMACDLSIATEDSKFGQTGPLIGGTPIQYGNQCYPLFVGERKAKEIVFLCRQYTAQEALQMGLVNKVVPKDKLWDEVYEWCDEIIGKHPQAIHLTKVNINTLSDLVTNSVTLSDLTDAYVMASEETQERVKAWLARKDYKGSSVRRTKK